MTPEFVRLAHRKAVWNEIQKFLIDRYVAQDGPAKEQIICEEVPFSQKDVTNDVVLEVLELIQQHECDEQLEMKQFEFRRRRPANEQPGNQQAAASSSPVEEAKGPPSPDPVPGAGTPPTNDSARSPGRKTG